jgi:hypothetical protein
MKKLLGISALILSLAACKDSATRKAEEGKELAATFAPIINGAWVMTDYINHLGNSKSPLASYNLLKGVVSIDISTADYSGDSLYVPISINNHEGDGFMVYFRKGHDENSLPTSLPDYQNSINSYELGYEVKEKDTLLVLYHYGANNKLLDKRSFSKIPSESEDGEPNALQRAVNSLLFAGNYSATNEQGIVADVTFTTDGLLQGFEGHNTFYIFTDFMTEEDGYKIDEICFDERTKNQQPFIFAISGDTTRLYAAKENEERTRLEKGTLKYTLVKKK